MFLKLKVIMKNCILKALLLCSFFILFSCENKKVQPETKSNKSEINLNKAGVVLTFDDAYIEEWFAADKKFKQYSWKATFCISKINTLKDSEIKELLELQKEGHEIAGHGLHHYNAVKYTEKYGIDNYIKWEINPMLDIMKQHSLKVTSFAYPDGERNAKLDSALMGKFKMVRGSVFGERDPSKQYCYFNNCRIVFGFDIDNEHVNFNVPYLLKLLDYAKQNNKVLILCSHKVVNNVTKNYQLKTETLELICKYIQQNNMKFYTLTDLYTLKKIASK